MPGLSTAPSGLLAGSMSGMVCFHANLLKCRKSLIAHQYQLEMAKTRVLWRNFSWKCDRGALFRSRWKSGTYYQKVVKKVNCSLFLSLWLSQDPQNNRLEQWTSLSYNIVNLCISAVLLIIVLFIWRWRVNLCKFRHGTVTFYYFIIYYFI